MLKSRKNDSFTLVEILVVVSIIGLLAGLAVPVISGAQKKAKAGACLSNLRQIGLATLAYAADNSNILPDGSQSNGSPTWAASLAGFMNLDPTKKKNVFVCPGCEKPVRDGQGSQIPVTYGLNSGLVPNMQTNNTNRLTMVARPSQVILAADMCQNPGNNGWSPFLIEEPAVIRMQAAGRSGTDLELAISTATDNDTGENAWMRYRHAGRVNVVMCDGHTESIKKGSVLNKNVIFAQ